MYYIIQYCIRECSSTLCVWLVHAAPPTQYKAFTAFSTNWLSEGSTSTYTNIYTRRSRFKDHAESLPVTASTVEVAKQKSIKMALSYNIILIIIKERKIFFTKKKKKVGMRLQKNTTQTRGIGILHDEVYQSIHLLLIQPLTTPTDHTH